MNYQDVLYCQNLTIIDCWENGLLARVIYVHRSEYRSWES